MPNNQFLRFCIVGVINTLVDVPVFVVLHSAGLNVLAANIISTSLALAVSLILNYKFTFKDRNLSRARVVLYFAVTIVGIWILQPLVISGLLQLNNNGHFTNFLVQLFGHQKQLDSLVAKLGSLAVSLVWNYAWYSRVVFKRASPVQAS